MNGPVLKDVWVFAHAWNHVICSRYPKCPIAVVLADVDLPYWTSKVEHIAAFTAILSNICTAHAQKRLFMNSGVNLHRDLLLVCKILAIWRRFRLIFAFCMLNVPIFLLPVCSTYWPRNYTTRVDPHVDNSNQVWSWYNHTLPRYSVIVCWYFTWPCDLDLCPFHLEQLSFIASHVGNLAT